MKQRKHTTWKGQVPLSTGQINSVNNVQIQAAAHTVFRDDSVDWLRWDASESRMEVRLNGRMYVIDPASIMGRHPLDVGAGTNEEPADLAAIRRRYEDKIENDSLLRRLRAEYDDLQEKYDIMKAIDEGKSNA